MHGVEPELTTDRPVAVQKAQSMGDFLMVGLHADEDVRARRGVHDPIMDLHERSLSVLACRYVNEVIIGERPLSVQLESLETVCLLCSGLQPTPAVWPCCHENALHLQGRPRDPALLRRGAAGDHGRPAEHVWHHLRRARQPHRERAQQQRGGAAVSRATRARHDAVRALPCCCVRAHLLAAGKPARAAWSAQLHAAQARLL